MEHLKHHLKHMAVAGGAILLVLVIAGVDLGQALRWAILLACPIGMVAMMAYMGRHRDAGVPSAQADGSTPEENGADSPPVAHHH